MAPPNDYGRPKRRRLLEIGGVRREPCPTRPASGHSSSPGIQLPISEPSWLPSTAVMSSRPSRALRPETEHCLLATNKPVPNPNWARAGKRIHREVYPGYARWLTHRGDTEEDERHVLLFQVIAILFFDRECAGGFPDMCRQYNPLLVTPANPNIERESIALCMSGGDALSHHATEIGSSSSDRRPAIVDLDLPLPPLPTTYELRLIVEYLLCLDYKIEPPRLVSVAPTSLAAFARVSKRLYDFVWRCEECRPDGGSGGGTLWFPSMVQMRAADAAAQLVRKAAARMGLNYTDLALMCFHFYRLSWATLHLQADSCGAATSELLSSGFGNSIFADVGTGSVEGEGWNRGYYHHVDRRAASEGRRPPSLVFGRGAGTWGYGFDAYKGFKQALPHPLIYARWQSSLAAGIKDRVLRKASVDVNDVIPAVVFDRRCATALTAAARDMARAHGIETLSLARAHPQPPEPEPFATMGLGEALSTVTDNVVGAAIGLIGKLGSQAKAPTRSAVAEEKNHREALPKMGGRLGSCEWEVLDEDLPHGRDDDHEAEGDVPDGWEFI